MITFEYTPKGAPVPDFELNDELEFLVEVMKEGRDRHIRYSTSIIFHMIQLWIVQRKLDWSQINFMFEGEVLEVSETAEVSPWPEGFLMDIAKVMERTVRGRFKVRREIRDRGKA